MGFCSRRSVYADAQDYVEALKWFRKAADQGFPIPQCSLGAMYAEGHGVRQDYAEAAKWFRKGGDQGNAYCQYNLGAAYANGYGVPKDYVQAYMWFTLAAAHKWDREAENIELAAKERDRLPGQITPAKMAEERDRLAGRMTSAQILEAQKRASEWKPK